MGVIKKIKRELMPGPSPTKLITLRVPEDLLTHFAAKMKEEGENDRSGAIKALMVAYVRGKITLRP